MASTLLSWMMTVKDSADPASSRACKSLESWALCCPAWAGVQQPMPSVAVNKPTISVRVKNRSWRNEY